MRERFVFVNKEEEKRLELKDQIKRGILTREVFEQLPEKEQHTVKDILFEMSSENVNVFHSLSVLEFVLIANMRLQLKGDNLNEDDIKIQEALSEFISAHELGDPSKSINDWSIDYLSYIKKQTALVLENRRDHIERKRSLTE